MLGMVLFVSFAGCAAPIKNAKTETFKVAGNCDMCKKTSKPQPIKKALPRLNGMLIPNNLR